MVFEIKEVDLAGRIGRIYTRHGVVETPAFFPVIDVYRQEVGLADVASAGFGQVITNAYLIKKRFGIQAVEKGVHGLLGFDGVVMTDSGAYQILEYGGVDVGQEEVIEFQKAIGSDIAVILDIPTGDVSRDEAGKSVRETLRRAREALGLIDPGERVWVLPIQGGRHFDLVELSAREAAMLCGYSMYGVGSPTVFLERYRYDIVAEAVYRAKKHLPWGRPVHLFGAGHPLIIPYAVALGIDTFDSASYILYARDGRYIAPTGVYRLDELEYFPCSCPVCSRYTPQDLREMPREDRVRLVALHNLHVISATIRKVKQAIREGRLWELLEETSRMHPAAARVMARMARYSEALARGAPRSRGVVKGLRAYGPESLYNPRLDMFRSRVEGVLGELASRGGYSGAVLRPMHRKPEPRECEQLVGSEPWVLFYAPFVGVVPVELCGSYPSIHVDYPGEGLAREVLEDLALRVSTVASRLGDMGLDVTLEYCSNVEWSLFVWNAIKGEGIPVGIVERC